MKHVILVIGYGDSSVLQKTIDHLDDNQIDFLIHWDKRDSIPELYSRYSKITFVRNRIKNGFNLDSQIKIEYMLMKKAYEMQAYDYVHLISSEDIPLMTIDYFKNYFKKETYYIGFFNYINEDSLKLYSSYCPIHSYNGKMKDFLILFFKYFSKALKINRLKNMRIECGSRWFSMDMKYVKKVLMFNNLDLFLNSYKNENIYIQTVLKELNKNPKDKYSYYSDEYRMKKAYDESLRLSVLVNNSWIDISSRTLNKVDIDKLISKVNTDYAFALPFNDAVTIDEIF